MSKLVKGLMTKEISARLDGVENLLLVNVIGIDANSTVSLRKRLREMNIELMVIKNSLARRATEGTVLAPAFEGAEGANAIVWGAEDFVTLAKEVTKLDKDEEYPLFKAQGGVMDGEKLSPERVKEISKWPNREELLSIIAGQFMGVPSAIASQLTGPATDIAAQVKTLIEKAEEGEEGGGEAEQG